MSVRRTVSCGVAFCAALASLAAFGQRTSSADRASTHGFAVVRVASNGGQAFQTVTVEEVGGRRRNFDLRGPLLLSYDNPVTFGEWLPAGEYRFLRFDSTGLGGFTGRVDLEGLLPTFSVEAGRLIDLGTLVQQPVGADRVAVVQWNDPRGFGEGRNHEAFADATATLGGTPIRWDGTIGWTYKDAPSLGGGAGGGLVLAVIEGLVERANRQSLKEQWSAAKTPAELIALSKRATMELGQPVFDGAGNAYFPSSLGQVLRRSVQGEWRNLDTGTLETIGAGAVLVDGARIYAGSLDGRLMSSDDGGSSWAMAPRLAPAPVTAIARLPGGDFVVATGAPRGAKEALLFRGPDFMSMPSAPWKALEARRLRNAPLRAVMLVPVGDRLIAWVYPRQVFVYDSRSDTWSGEELSGNVGVFQANAAAGILYSTGMPSTVLSTDAGATWQHIRPGHNVGLGFRDAMRGSAVLADPKAFTAEHFFGTTADGGKTWMRDRPVPGVCLRAVYLPPTDEMVCLRNDGSILTTLAGAEWTLERIVY